MQRVRLLGELGERFGAEFTYHNLRHPADAIKLLCINRPDFKEYLLASEQNGIGFKVLQADVEMGYEELLLPFGSNDLVITPVITGSGDFGKILLGIGLIALSFVLPGVAALGAFAKTAGTIAAGLGISLTLGGIAGLLSPQPTIPTLTTDRFGSGSRNRTGGPTNVTRGADGVQSYAYTGAANTVGIGVTVPVAYGRVLIGSHLLRSKVEVSDESDPPLNSIKKSGPDTFLIGGEKITTSFSDVSGAVVRRVSPDKTTFSSGGTFTSIQYVTNSPQPMETKVNTSTVLLRKSTPRGFQYTPPLFGRPRSLGSFKRARILPVLPVYTTTQIKTTKPAVTNAVANILATDTNSSSARLSIGRLNSLKDDFNVAFNLSNGLFNYAGGVGTTFVDAFITYEISVYTSSVAQENLVSIDQATVQGLLMPNRDNITWMHKMGLPSITDDVTLIVEVKILDTDAYTRGLNDTPLSLNLLAVGYKLS